MVHYKSSKLQGKVTSYQLHEYKTDKTAKIGCMRLHCIRISGSVIRHFDALSMQNQAGIPKVDMSLQVLPAQDTRIRCCLGLGILSFPSRQPSCLARPWIWMLSVSLVTKKDAIHQVARKAQICIRTCVYIIHT